MVIDMSAKNSIGMEQHHYRGISTRRRFFKNNSNDLQINMKWLENLDSAWRQKWYSYFFAFPLLAINPFFCLTPGRSLSVSLASTKTLFLASNEVQCCYYHEHCYISSSPQFIVGFLLWTMALRLGFNGAGWDLVWLGCILYSNKCWWRMGSGGDGVKVRWILCGF